ncbi:MAG: hypothetical protein ACOCTP_00200, partial [Roseicyclus sp.]
MQEEHEKALPRRVRRRDDRDVHGHRPPVRDKRLAAVAPAADPIGEGIGQEAADVDRAWVSL